MATKTETSCQTIAAQTPLAAESAQPVKAAQPDGQANSIIGLIPTFVEPEQRCSMIAEAAYYRAEHRGFDPGHELEDWVAAEREIDGMLMRGETPRTGAV